ncbi:virulence factor BrkB family protein [Corallincola platygyrae]|uniref:UPF0761 membrane protein ACFSJ3_12105 n=1 Tax=Corallincola platygyrae TaxID=1193278 RepID=A0ABW4XQG0_9GAMM
MQSISQQQVVHFLKVQWARSQALFIHIRQRLQQDQITMVAGYLAYVTLLSLVPLIAVTFSVFSAFPVFQSVQGQIEDFVFNNFVPASGDAVRQHLTGFAENAKRMTAVGVGFLMAAALLLISAIDKTLNRIWRIEGGRRMIISFSIYWMVLTLGPVLIGSSIAVTSYLVSLKIFSDSAISGLLPTFLRMLPFVLSVCAFLILYTLVPNTYVKLRHALVGAIVAASLFEMTKKGFALYVTQFPSYEAIYGALAAIPLLFLWIYLAWCVVLIGAELTAALGEMEQHAEDTEEQNDQDREELK